VTLQSLDSYVNYESGIPVYVRKAKTTELGVEKEGIMKLISRSLNWQKSHSHCQQRHLKAITLF